MSNHNQNEFARKIRSFVRREGRLTLGQQRALTTLWPHFGHELAMGKLQLQENTVLEIGFGNGSSLIEMAKATPDINYIGIEVHRPGVGALLLGVEQHQLTNITVFAEDALEVLATCVPDNSLKRVQLFFPDPWPKKRHLKRRIVQTSFLKLIHTKLQNKGLFHMATDWQPYAEYVVELMQSQSSWENSATDGTYATKPDYRPETKFERRGKQLGHSVFDLIYQKI